MVDSTLAVGTVRVRAEVLRALVGAIFEELGAPRERARILSDVLVTADLAGVRSHGVEYNIERVYVPGIASGSINPDPRVRVVADTGSTRVLDGDRGLGHIVAHEAMSTAIEKASRTDVAAVAVRNSTHFGMAGYYSTMASDAGMIGIALTNAPARVVPFHGATPMLGTNPIAFAAPMSDWPLNIDFATSTVSATRLLAGEDSGPLPAAWAADRHGVPTIDRGAVNALLPLGGQTADGGGHKGYGLAVLVDMLSGVLSGAGFSAMLERPIVGHFFLALRIEAFTPLAEFVAMADRMAGALRASAPARGEQAVLIAGDREQAHITAAGRLGIPLSRHAATYLRDLGASHGVDVTGLSAVMTPGAQFQSKE